MPESIRELLTAQRIGVSLAEYRRMAIDDADAIVAYQRGQQIAALSEPPGGRDHG